MTRSRQALKSIRFEDQLLPDWAQLLVLAASLSAVPEPTRQWFSQFTNGTGVEDARTVLEHCRVLRSALLVRREAVLVALGAGARDSTPATILAAWLYALDTMLQNAAGAETCSWRLEGTDEDPGVPGDGDITLRRV